MTLLEGACRLPAPACANLLFRLRRRQNACNTVLGDVSAIFERAKSRAAPRVRRLTDDAIKGAREVRLIAHAAVESNRAERLGRRQHQSLGHFDAPAHHIRVWRCAEGAFERAAEVARAEAKQRGELPNVNPTVNVGFDVRCEPACLPCRETSACARSLSCGPRRADTRPEARFAAKKRDRVRNVGSCRLAVTLAGLACSLDELRGNDRQVVWGRLIEVLVVLHEGRLRSESSLVNSLDRPRSGGEPERRVFFRHIGRERQPDRTL